MTYIGSMHTSVYYETRTSVSELVSRILFIKRTCLNIMLNFQIYYVQMDKLDKAFEMVKQMLYGRLHDILRKQIVERVPVSQGPLH